MKKLLFILILIFTVCLCSCHTTKTITDIQHDTLTVHQVDSFYKNVLVHDSVKDSVYIKEFVSGDTVFKNVYKYKYIYKQADTEAQNSSKSDSVRTQVVYQDKFIESVKYRTPFIFQILSVLGVLYIGIVIYQLYKTFIKNK